MWTSCGKETGIIDPQWIHIEDQIIYTGYFLSNYRVCMELSSTPQIFRSLRLGVITNTYGIHS